MLGETRAFEVGRELAAEAEKEVNGVRIGTDYRNKRNKKENIGGLLLSIAAEDEASWTEVAQARDYLTNRFDRVGLEWEMNDRLEQRQWQEHPLTGRSGPYAEILTKTLTREHVHRL